MGRFDAHFGAHIKRLFKTRVRGGLGVELVFPLVIVLLVSMIKNTTDMLKESAQSYASESFATPTMAELLEAPDLGNISGAQGAWYLRNWDQWQNNTGNNGFVSNIAYWCFNEFGFRDNETGFESMCKPTKILVLPEDSSNPEQVSAADAFRTYWLAKEPLLASQSRMDLGEYAGDISDNASLEKFISANTNELDKPRIGLAVIFTSRSPAWAYSLRMDRNAIFGSINTLPTADLIQAKSQYSDRFLMSGFSTAQVAVDQYILSKAVGDISSLTKLRTSSFPFPTTAYVQDNFWVSAGPNIVLFVIISGLFPLYGLIVALVRDKESRWKELLFSMGMSPMAYNLSWLAFSTVEFFIIASLVTTIHGSVFANSEFSLIFALFLAFFLAIMSYAFFIASLFERAAVANVVAMLIYFGMDNLRSPLAGNTNLKTLTLASLLPPVALGLTIDTIGAYETNMQGVTWNDPGMNAMSGYTATRGIAMLFFDTVLFLLLAFYLDAVMPTSNGAARQPWYFVFGTLGHKAAQTLGKQPPACEIDYDAACDAQDASEAAQADASEAGLFERLSQAQKDMRRRGQCVMIGELRKTFNAGTSKEVCAVDGLTTTFFENEISMLLGHNGAGKSTTDALITGLIPPTSGCAFMKGKSVTSDIGAIRNSLGLCPQKNVLQDNLTIKEHLMLIAAIKEVDPNERAATVTGIIAEVGLAPKANTRSKTLSGGMKRKLQLAMALIGDNKVIILDEPTSGMDTFARVATQRCIERHREGRVIILTTHYMDEADVLGDRVVVMSKGRAQCSGSALFLKSALGVGYQLVVQTNKDAAIQRAVVKTVKTSIPDAQEIDSSNAGNEVVMQLPLTASTVFENMLKTLEEDKSLGIVSTGISVTTLESVFLRLSENAKTLAKKDKTLRGAPTAGLRLSAVAPDKNDDLEDQNDKEEEEDFEDDVEFTPPGTVAQLVPLFIKRSHTVRRDSRAWCCQFITPLVFMIFGFLALNIDLAPTDKGYTINSQTDGWNAGTEVDTPVPYNQGDGLSLNPASTEKWMAEIIMPRIDRLQAFANVGRTGVYCRDAADLTDSIVASFSKIAQVVATSPDSSGVVLPANETAKGLVVAQLLASEPLCAPNSDYNASVLAFSNELDATRSNAAGSRYGAVLFNVVPNLMPGFTVANGVQTDYTVGYNYTGVFALPVMLNRVAEGLLRQIDSTLSITVTTQSLPLSDDESEVIEGFTALLTSICLSIAFSFVAAGFMLFVVREKENKAWHQQLINGVNPWAYWASNLVFDFLVFFTNVLVALMLIVAFDVKVFHNDLDAIVALFLLFGLAVTPFTFCFSFFFNKAASAQQTMIIINIISGFMLGIANFIMSIIENTRDVNKTLVFFFRIIPTFSFSHGLISIANKLFLGFFLNSEAKQSTPEGEVFEYRKYEAFDLEIAGWDCVFLAIEAVVFTLLLVVLQIKVRSGTCMISLGCQRRRVDNDRENDNSVGMALEDEDVLAEKEAAKTVNPADEAIVLRSVRKQYATGKVAVKDISLAIHRNEIFSLLGVNGAGKTTIFGMVAGELAPTSGCIFVDGINMVDNPITAQKSFGFCPQFDALFELLTGRECLTFYARMKGVPKSDIVRVVDAQIRRFGLGSYAHRLSGTYSGGNKRTLSVAQAALGAPKVIIMDEPSAGLDVAARHALHTAITRQSKHSTVVLTTHSMEECEALSDRIAIMVDGRLRCMGTAQRLKTLYGRGFQLDITSCLPTADEVTVVLQEIGADSPEEKFDKRQVLEAVNKTGFDAEKEFLTTDGAGALLLEQLVGGDLISTKSLADCIFGERAFIKILKTLEDKFEGIELIERLGQRTRFNVPFQKGVKLSKMFGIIESERKRIGIESYSLGQTSLEMIFNYFATSQSNVADK